MASRYGDKNRREGNGDYQRRQDYPDSRMTQPVRKKKGSAVGSFISTFLLVIAIGVFCYAAYMLYGYYKEYKKGTDEYGSLNDRYVAILDDEGEDGAEDQSASEAKILTSVPALENPDTVEQKVEKAAKDTALENGQEKTLPMLLNPIDFAELNAINEEIIGWIRIGALDLSYPVAQAADNDYYLHRTFERVDNFAGCIFLNCDNTRYFTDQNSIIYGHNMKNGSMFGTLKKFEEQETYQKCPYFWIFTPEFIYQYRIFSCSVVSKIGDPYRTRFTTEEFQSFIDTCVSNSAVNAAGVQVTTDDRIVTLSTCTGDDSTRLIVQGKLEQIYISK
ncbi:MAG: class B sortase [Lachnospiraceae bacterium]|nr:class B sortase [Lachnospiraceae bacterium]